MILSQMLSHECSIVKVGRDEEIRASPQLSNRNSKAQPHHLGGPEASCNRSRMLGACEISPAVLVTGRLVNLRCPHPHSHRKACMALDRSDHYHFCHEKTSRSDSRKSNPDATPSAGVRCIRPRRKVTCVRLPLLRMSTSCYRGPRQRTGPEANDRNFAMWSLWRYAYCSQRLNIFPE
jgi:hypothetical protein